MPLGRPVCVIKIDLSPLVFFFFPPPAERQGRLYAAKPGEGQGGAQSGRKRRALAGVTGTKEKAARWRESEGDRANARVAHRL